MLDNNNRGNLQSRCSSKKKKTVGCGRIQVDCSCTNASLSSSSKDPRSTQRKKPKTCKSCGGKLAEHGSKSQQGSMVRKEGLVLLKYIDPQLNWKRPSNGKPRTTRKARTSFTRSGILFVELKKEPSEESKGMSIAESEKVGVSILGRRFGDPLWSVPLKKRKHLSPDSVSSPCISNDSDQATLKMKQDSINLKLDSLLEESGTDENLGVADFSGISLLAATACDSITGQASLEVNGSLKANAQLVLSPNRNDRQLPQTSEDLGGTKDLPLDASSSSALYGEKSNEVKSDSSVKIFTNVSCKTLEFTSKEVKFPWDLNAAIDENAEEGTTYSGRENDGFDEHIRYSEPYVHQTNFGEAKNVHNNLRIVENREILSCEADMKHEISCYSQTEESKVSKMFSSHHTNTLGMDSKCESEDCMEAKKLINRSQNDTVPKADKDSTLVTEIDLIEGKSPINRNMNNNVPEATIGSEIDIIVENAETCSFSSQLKVETENPPSHLASCDNVLSKSHFGMDNRLVKAVGSVSVDRKSSYVDASFCPEERHPMVLLSENIFGKGTGCSIHVANSGTDALTVVYRDNSAKCSEYDTSKFELSNEIKLDAIDCDNMVTIRKDFSGSSREELPVYVNNVEDSVGNPCQNAVENHIECHKSSDLSQVNDNGYDYYYDYDDQGDETGKLEFLPDDDSQYEDGELRELPTNYWLGEGAEEDGIEMVDYRSDVDRNTYNATSDSSSYHLAMNNPIGISNAVSITRKAISKSFDGANKFCSPSRRLPDTCRKSVNKVNKDEDRYYLKSSFHDSTNRAKPSIYRDMISPPDISTTRNENLYIRRSRSSERNDFKPRDEMQRVDPRALGRNVSSIHSQDRGRSDYWVRPSLKYHSNNQRDSFDYRSSRNAAAAAIAKVESSGFVVAPDGTIVKSSRPRPTKDCSYQYKCKTSISRKSPIGKAREISPDRSTFVRSGNTEGNSRKMEAVKAFSSMQRSLSRRDHAFSSPRRRIPSLRSPSRSKRRFSLSRSPARSRTQSPCRWVSPRDRSPNFNIGSRLNRPRTDYGEDVINYEPLPRSYASPPPRPRAWRWNNEKKGFDHYNREYRGETQGRRFDDDRSHGRGRQGGFSSSMNFRRLYETFSRNDDDTRKPVYVNGANMKHSWRDDGIGLLGQNTRQNSLEFQNREGPRNLNRDSPRRPREGQGVRFRDSRGGNCNASAKSFDVGDGDLDESQ